MQCNGLEVESAIEVHRRNDVLKCRYNTLNSGDMLLLEGKRSGGGGSSSIRGRGRGSSNGVGLLRIGLRLLQWLHGRYAGAWQRKMGRSR